ncbi:hypothetical protein QQ045_016224 [Rhodiola kirilowii]
MKRSSSSAMVFRYVDAVDKLLVLFGTMGSIGEGLGTPVTLFIVSNIINEYGSIGTSISNEIVDKYALKLFSVAIGVGISAFVEGFCWTRTAERQVSRMRMEYLRSVLRQDVAFFDSQASSADTFQVVSHISTDAQLIQDVIAEKLPSCLNQLSAFTACLFVTFFLSWRLGLTSLPVCLLFIIPVVGFGKLLMGLGEQIKDAYDTAGGIAEQATSSIRTVYSYVGEIHTLEKFSLSLQKASELGIRQGMMKGLLIGSIGMVFVAWAFQAWIGMILVTTRGERGGTVFIAAISGLMGGLSLMSALPNVSFLSEAVIAAKRIKKMIEKVPTINSEEEEEEEKGKTAATINGHIEFRNVDFHYPSRPDMPILQKFNLDVQAGQTVAIVGGSGSGKSTIISLLERFYNPVKGEILVDGCSIDKIQILWLRSQMGLVNQEPILFATSITENILFGKEGASREQILSASMAANAHDFISALPKGYETQVGQFGVQLSGGQKQRIAIARALIRDPKILLLDEATSALDAQSEHVVQEALDSASQGRTTIIIAHNLTTVSQADKIVVLESGKITESGSHEELIHGNGAYSNMIKMQQLVAQGEVTNHMARPPGNPHPAIVKSSLQNTTSHPTKLDRSISMSPTNQTKLKGERKENQRISDSQPLQWRLLKMNAPEWKWAALGCLGATGTGSIQPVHAYCMGTVVSVYFQSDSSKIRSDTRFYSCIFLGLGALSFVTNLLQHYNFAIMGERLAKRVRERMLGNILTFEVGWFDRDENMSAAVSTRLVGETNAVRALIGDRISLLLQVFVTASLSYALTLVLSWRIAIVMIVIQPVIIISLYAKNMMMKSMSARAKKAHNEGTQLANEAVVNNRTITAFSSQNRILSLFEGTMEGPKRESIRQSWSSGIALSSAQFLTTTSVALVFCYGGRLLIERKIEPKNLFQVFFILMSTGKNIADAGSTSTDLAKGNNAARSIFKILDRKSQILPEEPQGLKAVGVTKGIIELRNVVFSYPSRPDQMIFTGMDLKIEAGKSMALVGPSGSGKSTVIGLIERFYDPIEGSVNIDGRNVKSYNLKTLRSHIALVSQEPTLFAGTIRENIIYGRGGATETDMIEAATQANAHEFISSMKDGYDTYCGERGVQLSGGQKQRIAIARAILKSPTILLLDEATSALDSASESLVQGALKKIMVGRTCIVVAHRLSTIQNVDTIAVINDGKVVEKGSHTELLSVGCTGLYYSLISLQDSQSLHRKTMY